jgi:hypothetical protein
MRDPVSRRTAGLAVIVVPVIFGAFALNLLGSDRDTIFWVCGLVAGFGGVGGWILGRGHPTRIMSAVAGVTAALGALAGTLAYVSFRGGPNKVRFGAELVLPMVLGSVPGVLVYYGLQWLTKRRGYNSHA